jgi:thiol-disulfide isomerase/thioredoxin
LSRHAQIALLLAVATVALIAGMALRQGTAERPKAEPGASQALLAAELPDLRGQKQRMDQWRGKVIIVNFWATWCAPCREEIPELIRAQEQLGPRGVQVVGIAIDQVDKVKPYAAQMRISYPVLVGELEVMDLARTAGNALGGLPYTVVLDRKGEIARTELGGVTQAKLEDMVRPLL